MKPINMGAWTFAALYFGSTSVVAQVPSRSAEAPMAPGVTSHVAAPIQSDPTQPEKVTDPEEPTAGHDDATGKNLISPDLNQPDITQAQKATTRHPDFSTLDANNHGYLTVDDVRHNRWLSTNFSRCDANHDGRLSQEEYANCK